jgi:hypothetical protein
MGGISKVLWWLATIMYDLFFSKEGFSMETRIPKIRSNRIIKRFRTLTQRSNEFGEIL